MLQSGVALTPALNSFLPKQQTWQTQRTLKGDILLQQEVRSILQWVSQGYPFLKVSVVIFSQWKHNKCYRLEKKVESLR